MSRARFGLLLALAAVAVAAAAFAIGLRVLDDDRPDPPPAGVSAVDDGEGASGGDDGDGATSSSTPQEVAEGTLPSPSWVLVVSSEGDEGRAREIAEAVAAAGHPAGVLRSDDHPSLNPGFWVAYAGPYPDADAARAARDEVHADGFSGAYVRCAGTVADCGGDQPPAAGDERDAAA